jgi:poly(A) polymerase
MILRDNVYGTIEDDVWRRDFTINALYYNIEDFSVIDYTNGVEDLKAGVLRLIGSPLLRYKEDPVRMLRVVRFASKLGFRIDADTEAPLGELGYLLAEIPPARLYEEVLKLFLGGNAVQTFELMRHYDLFKYLFPQTDRCLAGQEGGFPLTLLIHALTNTDERISQDKPVTPSFLYAAMLWQPMRELAQQLQEEGMTELQAIHAASREVTSEQIRHVILPRRFGMHMREIWMLQPRLRRITGKRPLRLVHHPRFRAAYDFLLLRAHAGEDVQDLCDWWTEFQQTVEADPQHAVSAEKPKKRSRRPRRKPRAVHASSSGE